MEIPCKQWCIFFTVSHLCQKVVDKIGSVKAKAKSNISSDHVCFGVI